MSKNVAAYLVGQIVVKDQNKWTEYRSKVPATIAPWGGELVFRGNKLDVLGGSHDYDDIVVIRFPDAESLDNWFSSSAYQAVIPLRMEAADVVLVSYLADE